MTSLEAVCDIILFSVSLTRYNKLVVSAVILKSRQKSLHLAEDVVIRLLSHVLNKIIITEKVIKWRKE